MTAACLDYMPLPSIEDADQRDFNPDTTYLQLSPSWGNTEGLITPVELVFAHTRHIFVADIGARDILVFNQAGTRVDLENEMFTTLDFNHFDPEFAPGDIDVDGRLNVLIINGSNIVYRWNLFWNMHGIDSVASKILIKNLKTGERLWLSPFRLEIATYLQSSDWIADLDSSLYEKNDSVRDSLLLPHEFLNMALLINRQKDIYYHPARTVFSTISAARPEDDFFYAADSMQNRILRAKMVRNGALKLGDGKTYFTHTALFEENVKEVGTGAGTVNKPTGMDVDVFGNLYYSQYGKHLYVHSVSPLKALSYPSRFELLIDDIMNPELYHNASDVAVDTRQMIYVANTNMQEILVFNGDGSFFKKAGVELIITDTTMWIPIQGEGTYHDTSVWIYTDNDSFLIDTTYYVPGVMDSALIDTFYQREKKGVLKKPVSVTVDDRGVIYVCDPDQGNIIRFTLSTSMNEELSDLDL